jgi:hypothetical protein
MRRKLSSGQTFPAKFLFPSVWLLGFSVGTVLLFAGDITDPQGFAPAPEMKWLFLGATLLGAAFLYWFCMRLKQVEIDEKFLYVSNFFREIQVPLRDIEDVAENRWVNTRPITVEFRRDTDFGTQIIFMPKTRWWGFWRPHPAVAEIEAAMRRARGLPPEHPAA